MTNSNLKIVAIMAMFIDHLGAILFPEVIIFRMVGRMAFPIFAFLLVEGYFHTKDIKKYLMRLGAFALISEIPFDWAIHGEWMFVWSQNIFFTLFIGLMAIWVFDQTKDQKPVIAWASLTGACFLSLVLLADYNILGILSIFFFYRYHDERPRALFSVMSLHVIYGVLGSGILNGEFVLAGSLQALAALSVFYLYRYNGEKGKGSKYLFYAFYPVHLILLGVISTMIK